MNIKEKIKDTCVKIQDLMKKYLYLYLKRTDLKIFVNIGDNQSCTDTRSYIKVSVSEEEYNEYSWKELIRAFLFKLYHEASHVLFTDAKVYEKTTKDMVELWRKEADKEGLYLCDDNTAFGLAHQLINCVEDGRIENFCCHREKIFIKYRNFVRIREWKSFDITKEYDKKRNSFMELRNVLLNMATIGLKPKGFYRFYDKNDEVYHSAKELKPLVEQFVTAKNCTDASVVMLEIAKVFTPYILKDFCMTEEEKQMYEDFKKFMESMKDFLKDFIDNMDKDNKQQESNYDVGDGTKEEMEGVKPTFVISSQSQEDEDSEQSKEEGSEGNSEEGSEEDQTEKKGSSSTDLKDKEGDGTEETEEGLSKGSGKGNDKNSEEDQENEDGNSNGSSDNTDSDDTEEGSEGSSKGENASDDNSEEKDNGSSEGESKKSSEDGFDNASNKGSEGEDEENTTDDSENATQGKRGGNSDVSSKGNQTNYEDELESKLDEQAEKDEEDLLSSDRKLAQELKDIEKSYEITQYNKDGGLTEKDKEALKKLNVPAYPDKITFEEQKQNYRFVPCPNKTVVTQGRKSASIIKKIIASKSKPTLTGQYEGYIDSQRLGMFVSGRSNVFIQEGQKIEPDMAVYILVDNSGSMYDKYSQTWLSLMIIEESLKNTGINFKIATFTEMGRKELHHIIKDWSDTDTNVSYSASWINSGGRAESCNYDAYAIAIATRQLLQRPEKDKIMFVLSDGTPSSSQDDSLQTVNKVVREARKQGIFLGSLFFGTEEFIVSNFETYKAMYEQYIVGCTPDNIAKHIINLIKKKVEK